MDEILRELYQDVILGHSQQPRNFGSLEGTPHVADGSNPLCGDRCRVYVQLVGDRIDQVRFEGEGCAISTASASLMTEALRGKTRAEARALFERFHALVTTDAEPDLAALGKLAAFAGVREFPVRVKCATLAWHTLQAALKGAHQTVTTE